MPKSKIYEFEGSYSNVFIKVLHCGPTILSRSSRVDLSHCPGADWIRDLIHPPHPFWFCCLDLTWPRCGRILWGIFCSILELFGKKYYDLHISSSTLSFCKTANIIQIFQHVKSHNYRVSVIPNITHVSLTVAFVRTGLTYFLLFHHRRDICPIELCPTLQYPDSSVKLSKKDTPVTQNVLTARWYSFMKIWFNMHVLIAIERNTGL